MSTRKYELSRTYLFHKVNQQLRLWPGYENARPYSKHQIPPVCCSCEVLQGHPALAAWDAWAALIKSRPYNPDCHIKAGSIAPIEVLHGWPVWAAKQAWAISGGPGSYCIFVKMWALAVCIGSTAWMQGRAELAFVLCAAAIGGQAR